MIAIITGITTSTDGGTAGSATTSTAAGERAALREYPPRVHAARARILDDDGMS
jgi:hypothetical protein